MYWYRGNLAFVEGSYLLRYHGVKHVPVLRLCPRDFDVKMPLVSMLIVTSSPPSQFRVNIWNIKILSLTLCHDLLLDCDYIRRPWPAHLANEGRNRRIPTHRQQTFISIVHNAVSYHFQHTKAIKYEWFRVHLWVVPFYGRQQACFLQVVIAVFSWKTKNWMPTVGVVLATLGLLSLVVKVSTAQIYTIDIWHMLF